MIFKVVYIVTNLIGLYLYSTDMGKIMPLLTLLWVVLFSFYRKEEDKFLYSLIILSIPQSYVNVFYQRESPLVYSLFNILLMVYIFKQIFVLIIRIVQLDSIKTSFIYNSLSKLLLIFSMVVLLLKPSNTVYFSSYLKHLFPLVFLFLSFIELQTQEEAIERYLELYLLTVLTVSLQVIIQYLYTKVTGRIDLGVYIKFANRLARGALFGDFSTLSFYLITPLFFVLECPNYNKSQKTILVGMFVLSSFLTTARTGIFALMITIILLNLKKPSTWITTILVSFILLTLYLNVFESRGQAFSDNGRIALMVDAFKLFKSSPILGVGFHDDLFPNIIVHNHFMQVLAQGGFVYFLSNFIYWITLYHSVKNFSWMRATYIFMMVSSMLVPNFNLSRFHLIWLNLIEVNARKERVKNG